MATRMKIKLGKHASLAVALLAPVFLVFFIWLSILIPKLTTHPKYDFLYTIGSTANDYQVYTDKLTVTEYSPDLYPNHQRTKLYRYDVEDNEAKEITPEEAQFFTLDKNSTSPDKIEIINSNSSISTYSLLVARGYRSNVYLKKGGYVKKLDIPNLASRYDFHFIAWILE